MISSDSDDDYHSPRYTNKKTRTPIDVNVTDLVTAGFLSKDNPASASALEDSLRVDLEQASKKLQAAKDNQEQIQTYLTIAKSVADGKFK